MAEPRAPQLGSSAMGLGHSRAPQTQELGHPMAELPWSRGPPAGSADSEVRRYSPTFRCFCRVKRPLNPTKQEPLCLYRRKLHNGSRITLIGLRRFEQSPHTHPTRRSSDLTTTNGRAPSPPTGELGYGARP